jgi:septal ring factor EnvC (AmiA/AmiB activator)
LSKRADSVLFLFCGKEGGRLEIQVLIPVLSIFFTATGLLIGFLTFNRNRDKDVRNDASHSAVIQTKLENIDTGVRSIQIDLKANERRVSEAFERIIRVEESSKQAHKRIDHIENKGEM